MWPDADAEFIYVVRAEFADLASEDAWNHWYDYEHVPRLLSVPGFVSATRFRERCSPARYLAMYEISSPEVFLHPRYAEVTGWGPWEPCISAWRGDVYRLVDAPGRRR